MKTDLLKYFHDIRQAAQAVAGFVEGKTFDDYTNDEMLRSGVERKFELIGEALRRIHQQDAGTAEKIRDYRNIVSFRNILAHGYDSIDDRIVWDIIENSLSRLIEDVNKFL